MTILIIDTSKPTVWVALVHNEEIISEKEWEGNKALGVTLLQVIEEITATTRPHRIAVHHGPGHFMAVRTGVVTAQLLAYAWGAELVEIASETPPVA